MKKLFFTSLLASAAMSFGQAGRPTGDLIVVPKTEEFVLGGTRTFDFISIGKGLGSQVKKSLAGGRILVVQPPKGVSWQTHRQNLLSTGRFASVEPDTLAMPTALSNDPSLNTQWHLFQISAPRVWDYSDGSTAPILAVVDGGVDLTHPDLIPNLVPGYNTISGLAQSQGGDVSDVTTNGHGTRVAGIAAARGNNGVGVAGVGWNLRLMPIRATNQATGATPRSELIEGATWAIQNGAKVVSVSYTDVQFEDIETLGAWARTQGALVVWSAGNSNTNWANFDHDNVTVVGGTDQNDQRWVSNTTTGSGFGKGVDCFAPATLIYTTRKGAPWYGYAPAGVSFAVPQVAATLALMMGREPTLSPTEIERRMLLRCSNMGPLGNDITFGYGRLNAGAAVEWPIRKYSLQSLPTAGIPGALHTYPWRIVDDGRVFGTVTRPGFSDAIATWRDGQLLSWHPSEAAFGVSTGGVIIYDVSESGTVVGRFFGPPFRGFYFTPVSGIGGGIDAGSARTYWFGINESGQSVGYGTASDGTGSFGAFADVLGGALFNPITSPPYNVSSGHTFSKVSDDGTIIGNFSGGQAFLFHPDRGITYTEPFSAAYGYAADATPEGEFVTKWVGNPAPPYNSRTILYSSKGKIVFETGIGTSPGSMNRSLEIVGNFENGVSDPLGALIIYGYNTGLLSDKLVPRDEFGGQTVPAIVTSLDVAHGINNLGQITVQASSNVNQILGFVANPIDTPGLGVNLGQLGSNPTYIGSIPPALSITFTDPNGVPYPNGTVLNTYRGNEGVVSINPPPSVTGSYRVYLRANPTAIPGYTGPVYLNRLYPPLGTPPAPRDSFYLPYSGTNVVGSQQPVLEMYPGDIDGSSEIDAADIDIVIASFGLVDGLPGWDPSHDVDGSGEIDAADIDIVIENFGLTGDPEP